MCRARGWCALTWRRQWTSPWSPSTPSPGSPSWTAHSRNVPTEKNLTMLLQGYILPGENVNIETGIYTKRVIFYAILNIAAEYTVAKKQKIYKALINLIKYRNSINSFVLNKSVFTLKRDLRKFFKNFCAWSNNKNIMRQVSNVFIARISGMNWLLLHWRIFSPHLTGGFLPPFDTLILKW